MSKTRGKILHESKHANNATCYAYFLAGHELERCQGSLGSRISSGQRLPFAFTAY